MALVSWKDYLGEYYGKPGLCESTPDFVTTDINKIKASENTTLRQTAQPVEFPVSDDEMYDIARMRWKFQNDTNCISLSAPQLGISKRVMFFYRPRKLRRMKTKDKYPVYTWINPSYEPVNEKMDLDYESCNSVKNVCALVYRFEKIRVKYYDIDGEFYEEEEHGLIARRIQHEIDHMNGLLFTDQAAKMITLKEHRHLLDTGNLDFILDVIL